MRWGLGVGSWKAGQALPFVLSSFLSGTFVPLRSLGTRGESWLGDLGIR